MRLRYVVPQKGRDSLEELITCVQDLCAYIYDSGAVLAPGHTLGGHPEPNHPENWKAQKIIKPGALLRGEDETALLITRADVDVNSLTETGSFAAEAMTDRGLVACSLFYDGRARVNPKKIMDAWDKLNPNRVGVLKVMPAADGMEFPVELDGVKGKLFKVRDTAFNPRAFQPLTEDPKLTEQMGKLKASVGVFLEVPSPPTDGPASDPNAFRKTLYGYAELARLTAALDLASQGKGSFIKAGQATCVATPGGQMVSIDAMRQWAETPQAPYAIMALMSFGTVTPLEYDGQISIGIFGLGPITGFDMVMPAPAGMSQDDMPAFLGRPYVLGELIQDDADALTDGQSNLALPMSGTPVSLSISDHLMPNFAQNGVKLYVFKPQA